MKKETYTIISKMAYLTGVPKRIFDNEAEPPLLDWYKKLERDKSARIIRHLCVLRTAIENNFKAINEAMRFDMKSIFSLPLLVPSESIQQLSADGIQLKLSKELVQNVIEINRHISDRLNNCKDLFPFWLKWDYVRALFIMPNGFTAKGTQEAAKEYYAHKSQCPYQVYLNWSYPNCGNIYYNDKKFVTLLYEANQDYFDDLSKVTDAGESTKETIYAFLTESKRAAVIVDCENASPYKLYAVLNNLDQNALLDKIVKIILYNDVHAPTGWKYLEDFTSIPIEHNMIERVKEDKSLVDIRLTTGTCREFFTNQVDSFILVSSDSDYWGLMSAMPEARFFVLMDAQKCSPAVKKAMEGAEISYCYVNDFCTGNSDEMEIQAVLKEVRRMLDGLVNFNIQDVLRTAYLMARSDMSTGERSRFYDKYIKPMRLTVSEDGRVKIQLGPMR